MKKRKVVNIIILIVLLVPLGLSIYFYYQLHNIKKTTTSEPNKEVKDIITKVSNIYLTPSTEEPTVATVSDPSILKNQSFFTQAEKGDKVLIFTKAGRAVLYRPSINKIIEITSIKNNSNDNEENTLTKEKEN